MMIMMMMMMMIRRQDDDDGVVSLYCLYTETGTVRRSGALRC